MKDELQIVMQSYLNSNDYELVDRVWVDYNDDFDRYDINIFFNKKEFIKLGSKQTSHLRKIGNEIEKELKKYFTNVKLSFYTHFE